MPHANWFFAFPLPGQFVLALPQLPREFRRYHPDDVHLTLAFLGPCGTEAATRALAVLDQLLHDETPTAIDISLAEVVPMGSPRRYSALSALLDQGRDEAARCITRLREPLERAADTRPDDRPAKPHVTLAKPSRRATPADRNRGLTWARALDLRHIQARLDRIALYTAAPAPNDRRFQITAERPLLAPP